MKRDAMVGDLISLTLAGWLFFSPWIVGFTGLTAASWIAWLGAIAIGAVAIAALAGVAKWMQWTNLGLGLVLLVAPWVIHITTELQPTDVLFQTGLIVAVIAVLELGVLYRAPAKAPSSRATT